MKLTKILSFATSLALVPFLFNSCEEKTTEPETPKDEKITLEVTPSSTITFKAKQNEDVVLTVKTNAETWDFTAPDWVVATKEESTLKVNVKDNTTKEDNIGRIEFTAGTAKKVVVAVMQEAAENDTPQVQKGEGMLVDKEGRNTVSFKVKNQEPTGKVSIVVRLGEAAQDELSVKVKLDPDFLDEYNYTNNTKCVSLPSEAVDLGAATLVVPKGATESAPLEINLNLANQEESTRYLATIAVDESSLPEGLAFPVANKRYNVVVMKELVKKIQNLVYLEVNNTNPLNLLEYRLEDGTPFFDAVVIHAANIRLNGNRVVLHKNPNIQELLDNSETYLQPLRKAGMKVLLGLLPDHTPAGLVNLSDKGAEMFAEQVADAVKTYKLDGVNLDEEYREGDSSSDLFNNLMPNGMRLIYQLNKKMNEKCDWPIFISVFDFNWTGKSGYGGKTPAELVQQIHANYTSSSGAGIPAKPWDTMTNKQCSNLSIECNKQINKDLAVSRAEEAIAEGYGWYMWYAFHPQIGGGLGNNAVIFDNIIDKVARKFYKIGLEKPTGYYEKTAENGGYSSERKERVEW